MSNVSLTPTGGWYADPMDAAQLRWWDGVNWTQQTTPVGAAADEAAPSTSPATGPVAPVTPLNPAPASAPTPAPAAEVDGPGVYIPRNSVFKMAEAVGGSAYVPEWSGIADISDEVALSGVPVQLALTAAPSEGPPIPVSADAFPILGVTPEVPAPEPTAPAWQVEQPLAAPIDQLFPVSAPPAAAHLPVPPAPTIVPAPAAAAAFSIAVAHAPEPDAFDAIAAPSEWSAVAAQAGSSLSPDIFPTTAPADALSAAPAPSGALFPGLVPTASEPDAHSAPVSIPVLAAVPDLAPEPVAEPVSVATEAAPDALPVSDPVVYQLPVPELPVSEPRDEPTVYDLAAEPAIAAAELPTPSEPAAAIVEPAPVPMPIENVVAVPAPEAPVVAVPAPVMPVPEAPVVPAPVVAAPAPVEFAPAAAGGAYEPLVARAIPQPVQLGAPAAPVIEPGPAAPAATPFMATPVAEPQSAAPEAPWPTEGTYQPHPGSYVPFDPNAVRAEEPLPAIPFSSRDPFNPASTSRPGLRSYGSAPVGPSGSTYTPALVVILLIPLLIAGGYALLFQLTAINVGLAPNVALAGLLVALFFVGIGAAQFDRNALAKRGYFDLASPFWILLSPLVYLGVRASRLHSQGPGGIRAVFLWFGAWAGAATILAFSTFAAITAVTPDRIAQTQQAVAQHFVLNSVTPTVDCPAIPSFNVGTVFNCTATSGSTVQLVQVTIESWTGAESYTLISTTTTPAATAATAP